MTLDQLALKHSTDKSSAHHNYCGVYEQYFEYLRNNPIKFVELGYGGYEYPDRGGAGIKMWREYFISAEIHCIELHYKGNIPHGVNFHQMSQDDERVAEVCRDAHIVCDDGSHINAHVIKSFDIIFKVLAPGGIYVIEDCETAYGSHDNWAGGAPAGDFTHPTSVNMARDLVDYVNSKFSGRNDEQIESVHFHQNLIIIKKK